MIPSKFRQRILEKGWCKSFEMLLHNEIKISPERIGNLEMQDVSNVEEPSDTPSNNHIRSISGNLEGREQ